MSECKFCKGQLNSEEKCVWCGFVHNSKEAIPGTLSYGTKLKNYVLGDVVSVDGESTTYIAFDTNTQQKVFVKEFNGVRMKIGYDVREKETGNIVIEAETKHCFTDMNLKPISLKKVFPEVYDLFANQIKVD